MPRTTRTLNPLHFEDFENRRFEDLVRQLIYDFRNWRSLEPTGRLGADDGYDARGFEIANLQSEEVVDTEDEEQEELRIEDRLWQIQCKRERTITPAKLKTYLDDMIPDGADVPHGVIFAAACDFSKRTRDLFRTTLHSKGVQEFYLWGKADLEDMLFQPKNDHLLYGFFGISLTTRRRTVKNQIRSLLATKRKTIKHLGPIDEEAYKPVLIRDAKDTNYPYYGDVPDFKKHPVWKMYYFVGHEHDGIRIRVRTYPAYREVDQQNKLVRWDYTEEVNLALLSEDTWNAGDPDGFRRAHDFLDSMPEENRAFFEIEGVIPYEWIVDIDPVGDTLVQHPHIFVDSRSKTFCDRTLAVLTPRGSRWPTFSIVDEEKRTVYFPKKLPEKKPVSTPTTPPLKDETVTD